MLYSNYQAVFTGRPYGATGPWNPDRWRPAAVEAPSIRDPKPASIVTIMLGGPAATAVLRGGNLDMSV